VFGFSRLILFKCAQSGSENTKIIILYYFQVKSDLTRDEELELLLNGLEKSLNEDSFLSSVISVKPDGDVQLPRDPNVLKILTEAGAKMSNCNSLNREGALSSQVNVLIMAHFRRVSAVTSNKSNSQPLWFSR